MVTLTASPLTDVIPPAMHVALDLENANAKLISSTLTRDGVKTRSQFQNGQPATELEDYEAPYGTFFSYHVMGQYTVSDAPGAIIPFDIYAASGTLDPGAAWLVNPVRPELSVQVDYGTCVGEGIFLQAQGDIVKPPNVSVLNPVGRAKPIIISRGPRAADMFELTFLAYSTADADKMVAVLENQSAVLLQIPGYFDYGISSGWYYVGDLSISRPADFSMKVPIRRLTLPVTATASPVAFPAKIRSYGTVLVEAGTYAVEMDINPTYALVEDGS